MNLGWNKKTAVIILASIIGFLFLVYGVTSSEFIKNAENKSECVKVVKAYGDCGCDTYIAINENWRIFWDIRHKLELPYRFLTAPRFCTQVYRYCPTHFSFQIKNDKCNLKAFNIKRCVQKFVMHGGCTRNVTSEEVRCLESISKEKIRRRLSLKCP